MHVPNPLQDFPLARLLDLARQNKLVQNGIHLCVFVQGLVSMCVGAEKRAGTQVMTNVGRTIKP